VRKIAIGVLVVGILGAGVAFFLHSHEHGDHDHGHDDHNHGEAEKAGHSHASAQAHGGDVTMTQRHHFEVVFRDASIRVYSYGPAQEPIEPKGLSGTAKLLKKGADKPSESTLTVATDPAEPARGFLEAPVDLKGLEAGSAKITFDVSGFADGQEPKVSFTTTFNGLTGAPKKAEPAKDGHDHDHH
jgi:hypothetical protein